MSTRFTPEQERAITTVGTHLCVEAGAGSGKTHVLIERIMHLLGLGVPLQRIVAITFTRKAAAEMKLRLREAIHRRAPVDDPEEMSRWRQLEFQVETARIATIDSFCMGILRENALRLGFDPEFTVLGDAESLLARAEAVSTALNRLLDAGNDAAIHLVANYGLYRLRPFLESVLDTAHPIGRWAGEYRELSVEELVQHWDSLAAIAREELTETLVARRPTVQTFDGLCADPKDKMEEKRLQALEDLRTLERDPANRHALTSLTAFNKRGGSKKNWGDAELARVKDALGDVKALAETILEFFRDPDIEREAAERTLDMLGVYRVTRDAHREIKDARNAMDFGDLLSRTKQALENDASIRDRVAGGIDYLLIDEFQDTNRAQLDMARALIRAGRQTGAELFIVGDVKQSIYTFRGAEAEVFREAKTITEDPLRLTTSFRSVPEILAFVNDFFVRSNLLSDVEPEMMTLAPHRDPGGGTHIEFLMPEVREDEEQPFREEEAQLIVSRIAALCGDHGVTVHDKQEDVHRPAQFGDVAILFRTSTHMETYERALINAGIPASIDSGSGYFKRQEIVDLRNLLGVVLDPWDEPALAALLRGPFVAVSDETLMRLCHSKGLAAAFQDGARVPDGEDAKRLSDARSLIDALRARSAWPLPALLRHVFDVTGIEALLLAQHHGVQKASNARKLVDLAETFSHTGHARLRDFVRYLDTVAHRDLREGDAELLAAHRDAITLLTVHKAKGLEFPIVVVADMGRKPRGGVNTSPYRVHRDMGMAATVQSDDGESACTIMGALIQRIEKREDAAEEARVLYVAMTRARDYLLLSGSPKCAGDSWMAHLDAEFGVKDRAHGDRLGEDGWTATVMRRIEMTPAQLASAPDESPPMSISEWLPMTKAIEAVDVGPPDLSVSDALALVYGDQGDAYAARALDPGELDAAWRGSAAHRMMERWDFAKDAPIKDVVKEMCPALDLREPCTQALQDIASKLKDSELWPLLANAQSLEREIPFSFLLGSHTLRGNIDVRIDRNVLVDYKTGTREGSSEKRYVTQVQLYAAAIHASDQPLPDKLFLYYLDTGELVGIDGSAATVAKTLASVAERLDVNRRNR